jgi:hypothetical protein
MLIGHKNDFCVHGSSLYQADLENKQLLISAELVGTHQDYALTISLCFPARPYFCTMSLPKLSLLPTCGFYPRAEE